ncbi:hypothetical protein GN244_ATG04305 [Phytophthora infestans]|uniref:Uncharacterized protein n=1 Tax=Phytophthora infestans TaxID=4787 RepID=A0A833THH4_PHYIN|nr:hypothetical protein GN244_ATG04305 [Phytophthora infestans]
METSTSPGMAVSGLMQQLKSGEISKLQLFQQLAKLQASSSAGVSNSVPPPVQIMMNTDPNSSIRSNGNNVYQPSSATGVPPAISPAFSFSIAGDRATTPFQMNQTQAAPSQFSFGGAVTPMPFPVQPMPSNIGAPRFLMPPPVPVAMTSKPGATIVVSNAELLATGVSHDKAKRLSVQEWMINKSRASASSQMSNGVRHYQQQQSHPQATEFQMADPPVFSDDRFGAGACANNTFTSHMTAVPGFAGAVTNVSPGINDTSRHNYTYAVQDNLLGQADDNFGFTHEAKKEEEQYLDFTEQFRDELDDDHIPNAGGNNGVKAGGNNNTDDKFHARVTRWKSQKDADREQMKQQLLQSELDECTFAPKINPKSTKVAAKLRGRHSSSQGLSVLQAVSERLYQEADNYRLREELATKLKADEEAEIDRQCTFRPKINPSDKVKAKYMKSKPTSSSSLTAASREAAAKELAECTFYPKVNGIRSEMVSAQLYLQQNIYERLSKPCCDADDTKSPAKSRSGRRRSLSLFGDDDEDRDMLDVTSCQDDISVRPGGKSRRRSSSSARRGQGPRSVDGDEQTQESKEERARQFRNFIERQKFHEQARHKRIELTKQQLTPDYKPTINKKSLALMGNGRKGDFLERISSYALRKEHGNVKKKTVRSTDPNCTFKPAINQASTKRKPRSITELSRGDLLRRETTQRLMKLKMEQEEMAALTFRPQLNRVSDRYEGRLKILSSPDTYLQRIQQQSQAHTIKQRRAIQEKEIGEFAECTFKPRTIEAPAYVQRIARSVSLTKALRAQQQAVARAKEKPEWK